MHGRNGRVDRFPSLGSLSPSHTKPLGRESGVEETAERWWETRKATGKGRQRRTGALHGALCNARRACARPSSLLHGDSTRCDRNLRRRSERAGNRESDKGYGEAGDHGRTRKRVLRAYLCTGGHACV